MSSRDKNIIVALLFSLVFAGCVFIWFPAGESDSENPYQEQRLAVFRELQGALQKLRDVQYDYHSYILSGAPKDLARYDNTSMEFNHKLSALKSMTRGEANYNDQCRSLSNSYTFLLDQLRSAIYVRKAEGADSAERTLESNNTYGELKNMEAQLLRMEEREVEEIKELTGRFSSTGDPWVAVGIFSCVLAMLFLLQNKENKEVDPAQIEQLEKELAEAKEQLEHLTHVDLLTGVLNKRGLEHALHAEESRIGRTGSQLVAVLVNCDNFGLVNEAVGEADGDLILRDVARRIVGTLRPSDHVARTGGDEFLVLLPDTQLPFGVKVAERIRGAVRERQHYNLPHDLEVTVSLGVATIPAEVDTVEDAITVARTALERSKTTGKNRVALGRGAGNALHELTPEELVRRLRDVDSYETVFLPLVDLNGNEVVGYEVLTRGPNGLFESPIDMFRLCVENDVLTEVDLHCLRLGIEKSKEVAPNMRVHFNIFPSTILETPIEDLVALFPAQRKDQTFWIELSEQNIVGDPSNFRLHVAKLRKAGVLVAVDDIGFSRQSLETLMLLEPDAVKVDRTYVSGVSKDKSKIRLLTRLVNVAKSLGCEVIAEGVENEEEIPILKQLGIHLAQGFYFGRLLNELPKESEQRKLRK